MIYKNLILWLFIFFTLTGCFNEPELDMSLDSFMYPKPGQVYEYAVTDASTYNVYGESEVSPSSIEIIEEVGLSDTDSFNNIKTKFSIFHDNETIIKMTNNKKEIVLKRPLSINSSWTREGAVSDEIISDNNEQVSFTLKSEIYGCSISNINTQNILDSLRTVIKVQCELEDEQQKTILIEEYASGLGMVYRSTEMLTLDGENMGAFTEKLINIAND